MNQMELKMHRGPNFASLVHKLVGMEARLKKMEVDHETILRKLEIYYDKRINGITN